MKHRIFNTVITLCFLSLLSLNVNATVKADEPCIISTQNTDNLKTIQENITEPITEYVQKDNKQDIHNEHDAQQSSTEETTQQVTTVDTNLQPSQNHICEKDGNVDDSWITAINNQLDMIPTSLIQQFQNDGWHIYCTDMNIDATYYNSQYGAVMGTTNYYEHRILIEDRQDAVTEAVIHEIGHWYDWHLGTVTDSDEFINIYNTETNAFKNTFNVHFYYDQKELFAEAFWKYITDNQTLKNECPMLYEFIARYM